MAEKTELFARHYERWEAHSMQEKSVSESQLSRAPTPLILINPTFRDNNRGRLRGC